VDVPLGAPELALLALLAQRAITDDAVAVADDARVLPEVEVQPFVLQIGPRERRLAIQRRLKRHDDLGHRRRVGGDGRVKPERAHRARSNGASPTT